MKVRKIKMRRQPPEGQRCRRFALLLSLWLSVILSVPINAVAQRDGLLGGSNESTDYEEGDRGLFGYRGSASVTFSNQGFGATNGLFGFQGFGGMNGDIDNQGFGIFQGGITNQGFGEEAPLGSGLLVLIMASAGYVTVKTKRKAKQKHVKTN